jgi:sRNA-binding carbon storage regulator CsrA
MLLLSRTAGQAVVIEDVELTVVRVAPEYIEICLRKLTGGKAAVLTVPHNRGVEICYDVQLVFVATDGVLARIGFEAAENIRIARKEFWRSSSSL